MNEYSEDSPATDFSDTEQLEMLENWFRKRTEMTSKALKLILVPVMAVLLFAAAFFATYYIAVPQIVSFILLVITGVSFLAWVICLFLGGGVLKKVRIGDSIMLRKIGSDSEPEKS
ncbi:MAG: hypothetical protein KAH54_00235 [Candidatus Sabulitectum sp.]|nr:hypothetical protein [Candidatus Sabulitectum sp.]